MKLEAALIGAAVVGGRRSAKICHQLCFLSSVQGDPPLREGGGRPRRAVCGGGGQDGGREGVGGAAVRGSTCGGAPGGAELTL